MEAWERWWNMAQGSLKAAQELEVFGEHRSSVSRAYYAAYQAATALLLYAKQIPPAGREAWSHEATPEALNNLPPKIVPLTIQEDLENRLSQLYEMRLAADYRSKENITPLGLRAAVRSAAFFVKTISTIVPGEMT